MHWHVQQRRQSHSWLSHILLGNTYLILCGMKVEDENWEEQGKEEKEAQEGIRNKTRKKENHKMHLTDQRCDQKDEKGLPSYQTFHRREEETRWSKANRKNKTSSTHSHFPPDFRKPKHHACNLKLPLILAILFPLHHTDLRH